MKKSLVLVVFFVLAAAVALGAQASKKVINIQKAYVFLPEEMLVNESDLNCSYFIRDDVPRDIRIVSKQTPVAERREFTDFDELVVDKGAKDGVKEGDLLMILGEGPVIHHPRNHDRLGRYFLKKSLAQVICVYDTKSVIRLQKSCNPVNIGDFAILFNPEETVFAKRVDYTSCRIPTNAITGTVVYSDLALGMPGKIAGDTQYVSVDLGEGVVAKGSFLLIYRTLASDLPPLIIGMGIVIHSENTNSTMKILDAGSDVRVRDQVLVLPRVAETAKPGQAAGEDLPVVETLTAEDLEAAPPAEGEAAAEPGAALNFSILFEFDSKTPSGDHAADFQAIKDFVADKSEYLITLRGYTCSIGGEEYNLRLSAARAEAVKGILVGQYGIDAGRIEAFFYGEKDPQFDNSSEAERRKNRLVKIEVNGR